MFCTSEFNQLHIVWYYSIYLLKKHHPQEFSKEQNCLSLQLGYSEVCSTPEAKLARPAGQVGGDEDKLWLTVLSNLELVAFWQNEGPH